MPLKRNFRAYTLVELLTVMAIIGILSATMTPIIRSSFSAARQYSAGQGLMQLGKGLQMYAADFDDTYPIAMSKTADGGTQTWFGYVSPDNKFDFAAGFMAPYLGKKRSADPTSATYTEFFGDHTGFGYNWETLGSNFSETKDFSTFPNCVNAATTSQITDPSHTVAFATSVFVRAPWAQGGDSVACDFGFVSPPRDWNGNPNMDFRHMGVRTINAKEKTVTSTGNALILWADGSMKPLKQTQVQDKMFERNDSDGETPAGT